MAAIRKLFYAPAGRRSKVIVLVFWLVIIIALGPLAGKLMGAEKNDSSAWLPKNAQSTQVLNLRSQFVSPNIYQAVVVYDRPSGLTQADKEKASADVARFGRVSGVVHGQVIGPIPSADGQAISTIVSVDLGSKGYSNAGTAASSLRTVAQSGADGMEVHIAGPLGNAADQSDAFKGLDGALLLAALAVVIVLLLLTYRSPILWLLPVVSAGVALSTAQSIIYLLATHAGVTVNGQTAGILQVLVFGAGTDYALLLTARYREELRRHEDRHEAMAVALRRAGPAILASGGTVILAMLALSAAELNSTKAMGPVLAIGIAIALLAMLSLLPTLLVLCGRWVFWPVRPDYGSDEPTTRGLWARVGRGIAKGPRLVWIVTVLVLGGMAIGLFGLQAHGLSNAKMLRGSPDSVAGQAVLQQHFPAGSGAPVQVFGNPGSAVQLEEALRSVPGLTRVTPPQTMGDHVYLEATLTSAPDSPAAYDTIKATRAAVDAVPKADALVGGVTAVNLDVQNSAKRDRNVIIPIVLVIVFLLLALLLRALVAPIVLVATSVLSFAAALGVSTLFINNVFNYDGADSTFPLFVFVFLVSFGIDYNIFLMTRVREAAANQGSRRGALTGLAASGGVIASAGLVLAGTFAVLGTLPVTQLTEIGFAVAFGVLLDTLLVRSVLITSLNLELGRAIWWPGKLSRKAVEDQLPTADAPVRSG